MKSGDLIYEQNVDPQGTVHQLWHIKGLRAEKGQDGVFIISPDTGGGDIYSVNFQASDFAGLDWISPETYSGSMKLQGKDVLIFKKDINPLPADVHREEDIAIQQAKAIAAYRALTGLKPLSGPTPTATKLVPVMAVIDLKTRLPIMITIGGEKRTYQYAVLTGAIPMASEVSKAVVDFETKLKQL